MSAQDSCIKNWEGVNVCKSIHSKEIKVVTRCLEGNLQMDHVVREPRQPGTCNNGLREKG